MDTTWKQSLSILESEVSEQVFSMWFLPIQQLSVNDTSLTLGVPNKFFESWLRDKYISLVNNAVSQAAGKNLSIKFKIVDTAPVDQPKAAPGEKSASSTAPSAAAEGGNIVEKEKEGSVGWLKSVFGGGRQMPDSAYKAIGLNSRYTFDNFVVGPSNRFAHAAALAVCDKLSKAYNPLFLYGGVGLGKTHLMMSIGHEILGRHPKARILYITSEEFTNQLISAIRQRQTPAFRTKYRNVDVLLIDDIQFISGKNSTQEEFFHTFNALHDSHKQIILCSDRSPQEMPGLEERLVSRFAWGLIADVQMPDFETRIAILEKKSENESVKVSKEVLYFLAEHIKTNIRELEGALIRVVAFSKLTGTEMTVDMSKEVLKGMISSGSKKITIDMIQKIVADFFGIHEDEMKTKKRSRSIVYPRQMAMYLSRELTDYSFPDIGGFFGGRDHTTVLHACDKITKEIEANEGTRTMVANLTALVKK